MDVVMHIALVLVVLALMGVGLGREWTRGRRAAAAWKKGVDAYSARDLDVARRSLNACVKLAPTWAPAHRLLGRVLWECGEHQEAEKRIRFGADLEPRNVEGHLDLAQFYLALPAPRETDALDALEKALDCAPALRSELSQFPLFAKLREHPRFQALTARIP
ncbi:MAG TPA: hypothetical protein PLO62_00290 [Candidatus Hydrogenedentes bacterium]|nr:hypothetical protein [Candidatus Hydrogenedentota bacterium]